MTGELEGNTAIVTGAASGIGREIANKLSASGATVYGVDISSEPRDDGPLFKDVVKRGSLVEGDVRNEEDINRAFDTANENGLVSIVVNNAGIASQGTVEEVTTAELERAFEIHLGGAFNTCRRAIPDMKEMNDGCIINISSITALQGWPASADYSPMKGALSSLTRQLAADYSPQGIRVNAVAPGLIKTAMTQDIWEENEEQGQDGNAHDTNTEKRRGVDEEVIARRTLLPSVGHPKDVANVVTFLASDHAAFITGQTISVDGGWSISSL